MGSGLFSRARRPQLLSEAATLADSLKTLAEGHPEGNDPQSRDEVPDGPTPDRPRPAVLRPVPGWYLHLGRPLIAALAFLLLTASLVLSIDGAHAATTSFQEGANGYSGTVDTFVDGDAQDQDLGGNPMMDLVSTDPERGLIRFDAIVGSGPGQIPAGATVTGATLTLQNAGDPSASGATLSLHRMLATWTSSSTWNSLGAGVQLDDVEAVSAPDASTSADVDVSNAAVSFNGLESTVQGWVDGGQNFGWAIFLNSSDSWNAHTSEAAASSLRPTLLVTYNDPTPANVVTVNSTGNGSDSNPGNDICSTGGTVGSDPECTLRAAIQEANASATVDTIHFNIPQSDGGYAASPEAFTIRPSSLLPEIDTAMTIDGSTQPEYATNSRPVIEVDGINVSAGEENGLWITGGGTTIRGLVINRFGDDAIDIEFNGGNTIVGNYIGTNVTGTAARPNAWGVNIKTAGNSVGGTTAADRNVISGNSNQGVYVKYAAAVDNTVTGNYIGTNAAGTGAVANTNAGVIIFDSAADNIVGGANPGEGNLIAYNGGDGVQISSDAGSGNSILGNSVFGNGGIGIDLGTNGVNTNDGGDGDSGANDLLNYPVITSAIDLSGTITVSFDLDTPANPDGYRVEFFTNPSGADPSGNGEGDAFTSSVDVSPGSGLTHAFSGSAGDVITATATRIDSGAASGFSSTSEFSAAATVIAGSFVVNSTGDTGDNNPGNGVCYTGSDNTQSQPACTLRAAIEESNAKAGDDVITFAMPASETGHSGGVWTITPGSVLPPIATSITVDATTQTGWTATPVVELTGTSAGATADGFTVTGDDSVIRGLAINRFGDDAINVDAGASGLVIAGNHIGTDATGLLDRGNGGSGIDLGTGSGPTTVGGTNAADRNIISGNGNDGIIIYESDANTIIGNYIGTDISGNAPLPNAQDGIALGSTSSNNTIGQPGSGNVLSGNSNDGLELDNDLSGNVIQANLIGLGADGDTIVANGRHGLVIYDGVNTTQVGGTGPGEGNVISGNTTSGVVIDGNANVATTSNALEGNHVGTDATGVLDRGNGSNGIHVFNGANSNTIGGDVPSAANVIAYNGSDGVQLDADAGSANSILGNSVFGNGGTGIDIDPNGVNPNDPGDGDAGANDLLNYPVITSASEAAGTVTVDFDLDVPDGSYRIELFTNPSGADPSGNGEGEVLATSVDVTVTGGVPSPASTTFSGSAGDIVTAAATEGSAAPFGSTSEFSAAATVVAPAAGSISGTVFEDIAGDVLADGAIGDASNPGAANVDVYVYLDDGDGNLDAGDTLIGAAPVQTNSSGGYSVAGLADGDYFVVVDSKTVTSSQDPTASQTDIWAEQTYGPVGGYCDNGIGFALRGSAGPCFAGITSNISDDFTQWDDREHRALVSIAGTGVSAVDFGFSFNVVVTTNGGDGRDDDTGSNRTVQGSLRQFIQNANAISGANVMRFVPADPTNATQVPDQWWRINVTNPLPSLTDAATTLDGTAYDFADGVSLATTNSLGPELELNGAGTAATVDGIVMSGSGSTVHGMVINRFGRDGIRITGAGVNMVTGNYLGTNAVGTTDLGNVNNGVFIVSSPNNTVGGITPALRNVISGNNNNGVLLDAPSSTNNTILGNYVGLNATGTAAIGNGDEGVDLSDSPGNTVGGTVAGSRNVISGNGDIGVLLIGNQTVGNVVAANYIGTNAAGDAAIPNGRTGVYIENAAASNIIGGGTAAHRNVISGNTEDGVYITSAGTTGNTLASNYIGTNAAGDAAIPNGDRGVQVESGASSNLIGVSGSGNVISGNSGDGVIIADWLSLGTTSNEVVDNLIGVAADGTTALPNGANGVHLDPVVDTLISGNTIAYNGGDGVTLEPTTLSTNSIVGNSIFANTGLGIDLQNDGVTVNDGGDGDSGPNDLLNYPVITSAVIAPPWITVEYDIDAPVGDYFVEFFSNPSGVDSSGYGEGESFEFQDAISHPGGSASYSVVFSGFISDVLTATLTEDLAGQYGSTSEFSPTEAVTYAALIVNSTGTTSDQTPGDGTCHTGAFNIEGDPECTLHAAIEEANALAGADRIAFAIPPIDPGQSAGVWTIASTTALPPINSVIDLDATSQPGYTTDPVIRLDGAGTTGQSGFTLLGSADASSVAGFMITRFDVDGVLISAGGTGITIADNWIGSDGSGSNTMGNGDDGIDINGDDAVIRNNVINHSDDEGIDVRAPGATIAGNIIGLESDGSSGSGNSDVGIALFADGATIGGPNAADRNVISNNWEGIEVNSSNNTIQRNFIGTDVTGALDRGNRIGDGIEIQAGTGNLIGGDAGEGNVIAFNQLKGVDVTGGTNNAILMNTIHSNGGLGIDLGAGGVNTNDALDADTGANDLLNYPVITSATASGPTVTLLGTFDAPAGDYRFEIFVNPGGADPSGYGEGETFVGTSVLTHTGSGDEAFGAAFPGSVGDVITVTITEDFGGTYGSTSEFSAAFTATGSNTAPTANNDGSTTLEDTVLNVAAPGVLGNDTDPETDPLTATLVAGPGSAAAFTLNPDGSFDYTPLPNFNGTDTFTYRAYDGSLFSNTATVTITVTAVNDAPGFTTGGNVAVNEDSGPYSSPWATAITAGPANEAAQNLVFVVIGNTNPGLFATTPAVDPTGTLTFTPGADLYGSADITIELVDDAGTANGGDDTSTPVVFTITMNPVNDAPVAVDDGYGTLEDTPLNEPAITGVLANDTDIESDPLSATLIAGPGSAAAFTLNPDGSFDYTPLPNFNGTDTFTYRAYDGNDFSNTATATITVVPGNDAPILDPVGNQVTDEQVLVTFTATASDVDTGDVLTFSLSGEPAGATITSGGVFTWTPTEAQGPGIYTFDVVVTDDGAPNLSDSETITVTVNETNQPPVVTNPGNQTNAEADSVLMAIGGSDPDVPANALTWSAVGLPTGLTINPATGQISGTIDYTAAGGSPWTVTVTATDDGTPPLQDSVVFTWTVSNTNRAPAANDDGYPVDEDQILAVAAPGVLGNDTDADSEPLTAVLVTGPLQAATFLLNPDGSFTYIPNANWNGTDTFTYRATDGTDPSAVATVTITVNPINDRPVANDDSRGTPEDTPVIIDVLTNDTDVESDPLSIDSFTPAGNGAVVDNGNGTLTYTPDADWNGLDTFTYTVTDSNGGFDTATVTVTVGVVNDAPVANDDTYGTNEDTPAVLDVLTNDTDVEGDALGIDSFTQGANGSVADNGDGTLTYAPNPNWSGVDTFTYQATDGTDPSNPATVTITVAPTNDAPVLDPVGDRVVDEQTLLSFNATAADIDTGDSLAFSLSGPPVGATINPVSGLFTWTPSEAQGPGAYTFDVVVADDGAPSLNDAETITVTVGEINRPPIVADPGSRANGEGDSVLLAITAGDPDIPVNTLTWSAVGLPTGLSINPTNGQVSGVVDYSASPASPYTVTVTATDNGTPALADSVVFTWAITNTNRAPIAAPDSATTNEDVALTIAVLANDSDPDLDAINVLTTTQPSNGTVVNGGGDVTYTPDPDWFGVDVFDVTITDGTATSVAVVTVTVNAVNDAPVLDPVGSRTGAEQTLITFTATASDVDVADTLAFRLVGGPPGAAINPATGVFTWTPTEAQGPATYTFDVAVDDNGTPVLSASETIVVSVTEANAGPAIDPIADFSVAEQTLATFTANATDLDFPIEPLTYSLAGAPLGAAIDPSTGVFRWTPTETQGPGVYTFDVVVADPAGVPSSTSVVATVTEVNRNPVITNPGAQVTAEGYGVTFTVTASDPDRPRNTLTWLATGLPPGVTIDAANGEINGQLAPGSEGTYTTQVTVTDGAGGSDSTTFGWTVGAGTVNSAPVAADDRFSVEWNGTVAEQAPGVLLNDADAEGGPMRVEIKTWPQEGYLILNADGSFTYTANGRYTPSVSFTYYAFDVLGVRSNLATVTIDIRNRPPVAVDDIRKSYEDDPLHLDPLVNDSDPDGDELTILSMIPSRGSVLENADGIFVYRPPAEFSGEITIVYVITDPGGSEATATMTVTVLPVNDAPIANADRVVLNGYGERIIDVVANDFDIENDVLSLTSTSDAEHGRISISGRTDIVYTPHGDFVGTEVLTYTITDGNGGYATGALTFTIPEVVFEAAVEAAVSIGAPYVGFDPNPTLPYVAAPESITIKTVSLMTDAFFQTVVALELPLVFLFIMLVSLWIFARLTNTPLIGGARRRTWAAVLLGREDHLEVRPEPLQHAPVIYRDLPAVRGIETSGRRKQSDDLNWIQIETPAGNGWVPADNLMEERDLESFMNDHRPVELLEKLAAGFEKKAKLNRVISPRGLVVSIGGGIIRYRREEVLQLVSGASDPEGISLFKREVSEPFLSAHRATPKITPKTAHSATALLPIECRNFLYLSLQPDAAGRPWLVFFEYVDGKPYVVGLGVDN